MKWTCESPCAATEFEHGPLASTTIGDRSNKRRWIVELAIPVVVDIGE